MYILRLSCLLLPILPRYRVRLELPHNALHPGTDDWFWISDGLIIGVLRYRIRYE